MKYTYASGAVTLPAGQYISVMEYARLHNLSREGVAWMIHNNKLQAFKVGRSWLVLLSAPVARDLSTGAVEQSGTDMVL